MFFHYKDLNTMHLAKIAIVIPKVYFNLHSPLILVASIVIGTNVFFFQILQAGALARILNIN